MTNETKQNHCACPRPRYNRRKYMHTIFVCNCNRAWKTHPVYRGTIDAPVTVYVWEEWKHVDSDAANELKTAFAEETNVHITLSEKDNDVLKRVLDTIFASVRSGKVDAVKQIAGVETMTDAAHLIAVRHALGN